MALLQLVMPLTRCRRLQVRRGLCPLRRGSLALESALPVGFERCDPFLPDVGRVADHDVEAALGEDFGEGGLPVEGLGMHWRVAEDAAALANGVVEAGQALAARAALDPLAELADLDGLRPEVHAVEVGVEGLAVKVEEGAR